jgi:hypothetical protein
VLCVRGKAFIHARDAYKSLEMRSFFLEIDDGFMVLKNSGFSSRDVAERHRDFACGFGGEEGAKTSIDAEVVLVFKSRSWGGRRDSTA